MEGLKTRRFLSTFCFSFCIFVRVLPLRLCYVFFPTFQCINPAVMLYLKVPCKCFRCFTQVLCLGYHQSSGYENSAAVMATFIITPPPRINMEGGYTGITSSIILSMCPIVSTRYLLNRSAIVFTKLGMVVYYHEMMCSAEKLVHYCQC